MQVERKYIEDLSDIYFSGGRVSNTWVTCPMEGDNTEKSVLIPHDIILSHGKIIKDLLP
jgi:hypothetical protein